MKKTQSHSLKDKETVILLQRQLITSLKFHLSWALTQLARINDEEIVKKIEQIRSRFRL